MKVMGTADVLTDGEVRLIVDTTLRILAEVGVKIPNARMLAVLADYGAAVDPDRQRVTFPPRLMDRFIAETQRSGEAPGPPLTFHAGAYPQYYADPLTGQVREHTLQSVADMTRLADSLENVTSLYDGMGVPSDVTSPLAPLYMRLLSWKHTRKGGCGQVQVTSLWPYAIEMGQVMADCEGGKPCSGEAMRGRLSDYAFLTIEMISPLQFGPEEMEQFVIFWERGLPVDLGQILSAGGTSPATLAGTVALELAENLAINLIYRAFYGIRTLDFSNSATVLDLRSAVFRYGRPELGLTHLAMGQLARHFGATFGANSLLGDAKVPSCEMGMQKALNAIPAIMAGTRSIGTLGLLSVDEIGSPIQLIIDDEYAGALQRFARGFEVDEEHLAFDLIKEIGPGGLFTGTEHTVRHYRREHWQPGLFSREMYNSWIAGDHKTDIQRAADVFEGIMRTHDRVYIREDTERERLKVIAQAKEDLLK